MSNYKHILLATDLVDTHQKVVDKAVELRELYKAKISIVNVVETIPSYIDVYGYFNSVDLLTKMEKDLGETLALLGEKINVAKEDQHLILGSPKIEIAKAAQDFKVDLIVIGTHTRKGVERLLGSTANGVLQIAPCDVLIVHCLN